MCMVKKIKAFLIYFLFDPKYRSRVDDLYIDSKLSVTNRLQLQSHTMALSKHRYHDNLIQYVTYNHIYFVNT